MKKNKRPKGRFLKDIIKKLDIPEDIVFNTPRITIMSNEEIRIENCDSVLEYECDNITISAIDMLIEISGDELRISIITDDEILIRGNILSVNFSKIGR